MPTGHALGVELPLWSAAPFALLLLSIAVLPLVAHRWWESNRNRALVSLACAVPAAAYLLAAHGAEAWHPLLHSLRDYVSFLLLLGALFVIAGGIRVRGSLAGTPLANTGLLAIGAVLANLIGTTGASMVLIRPLLRANEERRSRAHLVVFFIFVVSNCGGLLTPLGDPPLFLGFLKGVPFAWTLRLWREWLVVNGLLLLVFNLVDQWRVAREQEAVPEEPLLEELIEHEPLRIEGSHNLLLLAGVVLVILGQGQGWGTGGAGWPFGVQETLLALLAATGYATTRRSVRIANRFGFGPIIEVAVLFFGIFVTMTAPLLILNARGTALGLSEPWHYYWMTGVLSGFLDNAPTYLSYAAAAAGQLGVSVDGSRYLAELLAQGPIAQALLAAISCGAVMMGANTYIGNGPNFMVKAIAEESGVRMPSFFGYMAYSVAILVPIFVVITLIFFRP
jgi:Na+/H+ antiporter NhaD/arsenite permease-like protein